MEQAILVLRGLHHLFSVMEMTAVVRSKCKAKDNGQSA